jgi:hypothetical protein
LGLKASGRASAPLLPTLLQALPLRFQMVRASDSPSLGSNF